MTAKKHKSTLFIAGIFLVLSGIAPAFAAEKTVSALDAAKGLGADLTWDPLSQEIMFTVGAHTAQCRIGTPLIFFDYRETVIVQAPVMGTNAQPLLPAALFTQLEDFFKRFDTGSFFRVGAILIDPGHGGKDPGTVGSYVENGKTIPVYEKNIALTVSLSLYEMLRKTYPDKKILLTRSDDTYLTLQERIEIANNVSLKKNEAILYISIHANASPFNNKPYGFEVWYLPPDYRRDLIDKSTVSKEIVHILNSMLEEEFSTESILIAKNISDGLEAQIGKESKNRGLKKKEWFVVRNAKMPSVLIELGFVTNPEEAKRLNTPSYLQKCAQGIYNGLAAFISRFERQ
ncbi:N-acetylmuramoyl-L-alanine amidase [Treponema medium]|uniref:N-acetylmuramoyl-L-alanine amidase n=1 Tax=Treponema medium TaxID=58231 RepID=UPI00197D127B|nr:N-acetylmuramoyl-L-alanine amidase [Treponema medium]QSH93191.1 N-acetylmuramoyl-L-alanine amidase [Treponema medium]